MWNEWKILILMIMSLIKYSNEKIISLNYANMQTFRPLCIYHTKKKLSCNWPWRCTFPRHVEAWCLFGRCEFEFNLHHSLNLIFFYLQQENESDENRLICSFAIFVNQRKQNWFQFFTQWQYTSWHFDTILFSISNSRFWIHPFGSTRDKWTRLFSENWLRWTYVKDLLCVHLIVHAVS